MAPKGLPKQVSEHMARIGRKGGQAARGASKRRDPEHYRMIQAAGLAVRRERAKLRKLSTVAPEGAGGVPIP